MSEMKDSGIEWIGEIPKDWKRTSLLNLLRCKISDGPHETPSLIDEGIPFISVDSLGENQNIDFSKVKRFISEEDYIEYNKKANLEKGDILFSKAATIGKTAIVRDEKFMVWSPLAIIKANEKICNNKYIYYLLNCEQLIKYVSLLGGYNTQINVGMRTLEKAFVPFPNIEEQNKIAGYLDDKCDKIDKMIAREQEEIEKLKEYKQSIITKTVTKGINEIVECRKSKFEYLGKIPSHWKEIKLRYLGKCTNGISKSAEFFGTGYPFVSYGDVYNNIQLPTNVTGKVKVSEQERENYSVKYGDVFFTRTSETIEEVGFTSTCLKTIENAVFAGFVIRFRPNKLKKLNPRFSKYYFRSNIHRMYFVKKMNLVTRASLSQELLKGLPVLLPPLEEQEKIADYLEKKCNELNKLIGNSNIKIEKLKEYKKSLIFECVTGKKEVD